MTPKDFLFSTRRYIDGIETPLIQREETAEFIVSYIIAEIGMGAEFFDFTADTMRVTTTFLNARDESSIIAQRLAQDMSRLKTIVDTYTAFLAHTLTDEQRHVSHLLLKQRSNDPHDNGRYNIFTARGYRIMLMMLGDENPQEWVDAKIQEKDLVSALTQYLFEGASKADLLEALTVTIKRNLAGNPV